MQLPQPPTAPVRSRNEGALGPYLRAIRAHRLLVVCVTLIALAGAIGWLVHRAPQYQAKSEILVSPIPQDDPTFLGIQGPVVDSPSDPTRAIQTAATLVDSPIAARLAAQRIGRGYTYRTVQQQVQVQPEGQTNILDVTATVPNDAPLSATVANQFARSALQVRGQALHSQINAQIRNLQAQYSATAPVDTVTRSTIATHIQQLQSADNGTDPTLSMLQVASVPTSATGTPGWLVVVLALIAGFMIGTGAALIIEMLDRHVRDPELLDLYPLPVLARIPKLPRRLSKSGDKSPLAMPPAVREGFRTLLVQLEQRPGSHRTIMMTSATSRDGKTTSAVNLAFALVGAGHRVILIDFDLRKPDVSNVLGTNSNKGLVSLLADDTKLQDLLVPAQQLPPLKVVPAGTDGDVVLLEALTRRLPEVLKQAEQLADYVILDTAPLGEVSDALRIADHVDEIILVVRPGHTYRANFEYMRDLLQQTGQTPLGYLLIGTTSGTSSAYYSYGVPQRKERAGLSRLARSSR